MPLPLSVEGLRGDSLTLLPDGVASAWRDPTGKVAIVHLPIHEAWVGHTVAELEQAINARVAFLMRFGTGVLPNQKTVVQADDQVYVSALSGTISDVSNAATQPPEESS